MREGKKRTARRRRKRSVSLLLFFLQFWVRLRSSAKGVSSLAEPAPSSSAPAASESTAVKGKSARSSFSNSSRRRARSKKGDFGVGLEQHALSFFMYSPLSPSSQPAVCPSALLLLPYSVDTCIKAENDGGGTGLYYFLYMSSHRSEEHRWEVKPRHIPVFPVSPPFFLSCPSQAVVQKMASDTGGNALLLRRLRRL